MADRISTERLGIYQMFSDQFERDAKLPEDELANMASEIVEWRRIHSGIDEQGVCPIATEIAKRTSGETACDCEPGVAPQHRCGFCIAYAAAVDGANVELRRIKGELDAALGPTEGPCAKT